MIANLLLNEATHRSLDLVEKQPLLITIENAFDQKKLYLSFHLMDQCLILKLPVTVTILLICRKSDLKYAAKQQKRMELI